MLGHMQVKTDWVRDEGLGLKLLEICTPEWHKQIILDCAVE